MVKKGNAKLSEDDVRSYVKQHTARYKVPRDVEFMDELPRNPTGKVLKRELRGDSDGSDSDSDSDGG